MRKQISKGEISMTAPSGLTIEDELRAKLQGAEQRYAQFAQAAERVLQSAFAGTDPKLKVVVCRIHNNPNSPRLGADGQLSSKPKVSFDIQRPATQAEMGGSEGTDTKTVATAEVSSYIGEQGAQFILTSKIGRITEVHTLPSEGGLEDTEFPQRVQTALVAAKVNGDLWVLNT
jgi:hypothetical protein